MFVLVQQEPVQRSYFVPLPMQRRRLSSQAERVRQPLSARRWHASRAAWESPGFLAEPPLHPRAVPPTLAPPGPPPRLPIPPVTEHPLSLETSVSLHRGHVPPCSPPER